MADGIPTPPILGYRELSQAKVDQVNKGKALALQVEAYVQECRDFVDKNESDEIKRQRAHRWASIGGTDLQKGFTEVFRSVFNPDGF